MTEYKMTDAERAFIARMLPHAMAGKSFEDAARAVLEDDERLWLTAMAADDVGQAIRDDLCAKVHARFKMQIDTLTYEEKLLLATLTQGRQPDNDTAADRVLVGQGLAVRVDPGELEITTAGRDLSARIAPDGTCSGPVEGARAGVIAALGGAKASSVILD